MSGKRLLIKRECTHGGRHKHGTPVAYSADRCRCDACSGAYIAIAAERRRLKAAGVWESPFVDAEPARVHAQALMAGGMTKNAIVARSGIPAAVLSALLWGRSGRGVVPTIRRDNADAILGTRLAVPAAKTVDAVGAHRRMQALIANGWCIAALGRQLGVSPERVSQYLRQPRLALETLAAVSELYDRLWNVPVPEGTRWEKIAAARARSSATKMGWLPPLAWDDDTIDDPAASPRVKPITSRARRISNKDVDPVIVDRLVAGTYRGQSSPAERREAILILAARTPRLSNRQIGERVGMTHDSVLKVRQRERVAA